MNPEHIPHLINIAFGGLTRTVTPDDVVDHLTQSGHVTKAIGGVVATEDGYNYLMENGHHPWQGR